MTFSQNFIRMEKIIGKEQANRIFTVLNTLNLDSLDNQSSKLYLKFFAKNPADESSTHLLVEDDQELSKNGNYLLISELPGNTELRIFFNYLNFSVKININGVSYFWYKDNIDETLNICPAGEIVTMILGTNKFAISYTIREKKNSVLISLNCNNNIPINLDCTSENITIKKYNLKKQIAIEELSGIMDDFLNFTSADVGYGDLKYEDIKKIYALMRETILNIVNQIRQTSGLPPVDWPKKEKEQTLAKEQKTDILFL